MILLLDIGNTRIKWALLDSDKLLPGEAIPNGDLQQLAHYLDGLSIEFVLASNVASEPIKQQLNGWFEDKGLTINYAVTEREWYGLKNGYHTPEKLGVDRWLAMLAASHDASGKPCCIVDCGSAMTVDIVDQHGQHLGGVISPGLRLMSEALLNGTALDVAASSDSKAEWPIETASAIQTGCQMAVAGLAQMAIIRFREQFGKRGKIYLTGGDAERIKSLLPVEVMYDPWLVLKGLAMEAKKAPTTISIELRSP